LPGPDDVLEFQMPPLAVQGAPAVPDTFAVRLRLRPVKGRNRSVRRVTRVESHRPAGPLRAQGMDLADVQALMGHKSAKTTQRYAMVAPKKLAAAAQFLHEAWHPAGNAVPAAGSKTGTE
jgi:hypothetical protein